MCAHLCIRPVLQLLLLLLLGPKPTGGPSVSALMLLDGSPRPPTTRARPGTAVVKLPVPVSAMRCDACAPTPVLPTTLLLLLLVLLPVPFAPDVGPEGMPGILLLLPVLLLLG